MDKEERSACEMILAAAATAAPREKALDALLSPGPDDTPAFADLRRKVYCAAGEIRFLQETLGRPAPGRRLRRHRRRAALQRQAAGNGMVHQLRPENGRHVRQGQAAEKSPHQLQPEEVSPMLPSRKPRSRRSQAPVVLKLLSIFALLLMPIPCFAHDATTNELAEAIEELRSLQESLDDFVLPESVAGTWQGANAACEGNLPPKLIPRTGTPGTPFVIRQAGNYLMFEESNESGAGKRFTPGAIRGKHARYDVEIHKRSGSLRLVIDAEFLSPTRMSTASYIAANYYDDNYRYVEGWAKCSGIWTRIED